MRVERCLVFHTPHMSSMENIMQRGVVHTVSNAALGSSGTSAVFDCTDDVVHDTDSSGISVCCDIGGIQTDPEEIPVRVMLQFSCEMPVWAQKWEREKLGNKFPQKLLPALIIQKPKPEFLSQPWWQQSNRQKNFFTNNFFSLIEKSPKCMRKTVYHRIQRKDSLCDFTSVISISFVSTCDGWSRWLRVDIERGHVQPLEATVWLRRRSMADLPARGLLHHRLPSGTPHRIVQLKLRVRSFTALSITWPAWKCYF